MMKKEVLILLLLVVFVSGCFFSDDDAGDTMGDESDLDDGEDSIEIDPLEGVPASEVTDEDIPPPW